MPTRRLSPAYMCSKPAQYADCLPFTQARTRSTLGLVLGFETLHALKTRDRQKAWSVETERMHNMSQKPSQLQCRQTTRPLKQPVPTNRLRAGASPHGQARARRHLTIARIAGTAGARYTPPPSRSATPPGDTMPMRCDPDTCRIARNRLWRRLLKGFHERWLLAWSLFSGASSQMTVTIHASVQSHKGHPASPPRLPGAPGKQMLLWPLEARLSGRPLFRIASRPESIITIFPVH